MSDVLHVSTLGGLELARHGAPLTGFHSRKVDALIVYLVATRQPQPRHVLADLLWDEQTQAAANLRVLLSDLRQFLAPFFLITRDSVEVNPSAEIWYDAAAFESQLAGVAAAPALRAPALRARTRESANALERALALYRGDFLKGFYIRESPRFEEWVLLEQERLRRRAVVALQNLTDYFLHAREYLRGIETASRLFEIDPLNELTQQQMMELLARSGEPNAALAQYEKYRQLLARELAADPSPETTTLRDQIRAGTFAEKLNLGAHSNLPRALTPFVGRAQELAELEAYLRDAQTPLITLTGEGGVGKTRLALRAAENVADQFRAGAVFVALASVTAPDAVMAAIAAALNVTEKRGETLARRVEKFLRDKQLLLLLDNFEQVLDAAPRVTDLLSACRHLKILVTSRERLRLYGEQNFPVMPLPFPNLAQLSAPAADLAASIARYPAVALFVQRATAAQPNFQLTAANARAVAEICARLDGLALAIELAAAHVNLVSPDALLMRLTNRLDLLSDGDRDRAPRHQTIRRTLDWSYALLDAPEKKLFRTLAVFVGGWTLDAAEQLANHDPHVTLNLLTRLVEKSLVQRVAGDLNAPRFILSETIRAYALERLDKQGEAAECARRHAFYFLELAREAEPYLLGPSQAQWLDKIERDLENVRAALEWMMANGQTESGLEMAHKLGRFWTIHDHWAEGRRWLERFLEMPEATASALTRARAHFSAGLLATFMSDQPGAHKHFDAAQRLNAPPGDEYLAAQILACSGTAYQLQGDLKTARQLAEQADALFDRVGTRYDKAWCACTLAGIQLSRGRFFAARDRFANALAEFHRVGDLWGCAVALSYLAFIARITLQRAQASAYKAKALALFEQTGDRARIGTVHFFLGAPSNEPEEQDTELAYFQERVNTLARQNDRVAYARALLGLAGALHRRGEQAQAKKFFAECMVLCVELGLESESAECLEGFAGIAATQEHAARAARLFGAADVLNRALRGPVAQSWRANYGADLDLARAQLDERAFNQRWAEGRAMPFAQAVAYALSPESFADVSSRK